jgi:geranylgeranyl diphosphate synthase, type I
MEWLKSLYPEVEKTLLEAVPAYWPGFGDALTSTLNGRLPTEVALPLAACRAVGGNPADAVPVTAGLLAISISMRIMDDMQDRDRAGQLWELVGPARAFNYATAAQFLCFEIIRKASYPDAVFHRIHHTLLSASLHLTAGQDRDLYGATTDFAAYWQMMEMKSATAYSLACASGAQVGTNNSEWVNACGVFGHHVGMCMQLFNDMESIWDPSGVSDIEQGKYTLPLLYGLGVDHPERTQLQKLATNGVAENAAAIVEILEGIDTKKCMIWLALKEREQALEALEYCPDEEGKTALNAYITSMFGDLVTAEPA